MGDVYDAVGPESGQRAAVKLIRRDRAADPRSLALFAAEARALSRVRSDRVASVLEVGGIGAEVPFIAMERVEGRTLALVLQERGRLALPELRVLVRDVAQGLADVHAAGVFHRDIKPQNIAQTGDGANVRWKILDFGVAQIHDLVGAARSTVAGTPRYMAPEQALGEAIDARADLYSLCLVTYRALTGRPAYLGWNRLDIARAALTQPAPDPRWYATVPKQVELVLRVGLAARREDRFSAAAELGAAFEAACDGRLSTYHRARAEALLAREPWSDPERAALPPETPEPSTHVSPGTSSVV
jgi:serine/threonine-protein kinase